MRLDGRAVFLNRYHSNKLPAFLSESHDLRGKLTSQTGTIVRKRQMFPLLNLVLSCL